MQEFIKNQDDFYQAAFIGVEKALGAGSLARLQQARVLVVGLGGVGSWLAEGLVRSGVGQLTLMDLDDVCVSNLNRQLPAMLQTVGQSKIQILRQRFLAINPFVQVQLREDFLTAENIDSLPLSDYDVVVDAIDTLKNKCVLAHACYQKKIPLVVMGAAGGLSRPEGMRVTDLNHCEQDDLLRRMKKNLRREFGMRIAKEEQWGIAAVHVNSKDHSQNKKKILKKRVAECAADGRNLCTSDLGSLCFVTGSFGFMGASAVVERILKAGL